MRKKWTFLNSEGKRLAGIIDIPKQWQTTALFAHCFTCGKDLNVVHRISKSLAEKGIAVFRFDFTGLGQSEGAFEETNFSSNVRDLSDAAQFLKQEYKAPSLLIGHSLGGTAILKVANQIPEARGVITIGSPASPSHVLQQLADKKDEIESKGEATVSLGGRPFSIKKQFIEDLEENSVIDSIAKLHIPLLIFHAPLDQVVSIQEAGKIYEAAKHPKSFIALDGADHLVSKKEDAEYVATFSAAWFSKYAQLETNRLPTTKKGNVLTSEVNTRFLREIYTDDHHFYSDEPASMGGDNMGPDPYELLLAALGSCTSMTIRMYANRKKWPLENVDVTCTHDRRHTEDCENCEEGKPVDVIHRTLSLSGDLSEHQRQKLLEIANKCPVHKTLLNLGRIETNLE